MATASMKMQKRRSRRRIAAVNFLSNISLDGTYRDTKHALFNPKHQRLKPNLIEEAENNVNKCSSEIVSDDECNESSKDGTKSYPAEKAGHKSVVVQNNSVQKCENVCAVQRNPSKSKRGSITVNIVSEREKLKKEAVLSHNNRDIQVDKSPRQDSCIYRGKDIRKLNAETNRMFHSERLMIVSKKKTPVIVSSTVMYSRKLQCRREEEIHGRTRNASGSKSFSSQEGILYMGLHSIAKVEEGQDISYGGFLVPSRGSSIRRTSSERGPLTALETLPHQMLNAGRELSRSRSYDPNLQLHRASNVPSLQKVPEESADWYDPNTLDDRELQSGSYRTLLTLPSYVTSVIDYVKPSTLKKEINEKFKEKYPAIQLTLTKMRSLKKELKNIAHNKCSLDLWIVAQAYVYFEKLILKLMINKQNRKLCAGACLLLSAKLGDVKGAELTKLIEQTEDDFRLHRKELLVFEFACLVALEFSLHIPDTEIFPHYQRLLYQS